MKKDNFFLLLEKKCFLGPLKDRVLYYENSIVYSSTSLNT